jgi:hypothetical protein
MLDMPEFATYKKNDLIIKDGNYYKGNVNSWQRPEPTCKKIYKYYH